MNDFVTIAERLGIPTALLIVLGTLMYRLLIWLLKRHARLLDVQEQALGQIAPELRAQTALLRKIADEGCGRVPDYHCPGSVLPMPRKEPTDVSASS